MQKRGKEWKGRKNKQDKAQLIYSVNLRGKVVSFSLSSPLRYNRAPLSLVDTLNSLGQTNQNHVKAFHRLTDPSQPNTIQT